MAIFRLMSLILRRIWINALIALVLLCYMDSKQFVTADRSGLPQTCNSTIYCYGPLLDTVQMAGIYNDSKTFVDMKLKRSPNETLEAFHEMMNYTNNKPTQSDVDEFVTRNFDSAGSEFENWKPDDWKDDPAFLRRIKDPGLHDWGAALNRLWLELGRKMKREVKEHQELYSIIYVDHPVIVPGGRFREFYYWDSYWIIRGLLLSEMKTTVRGMLDNFLDIVERFGHIPNGGRIYYRMRSHPPLLVPMVKSYIDYMNDKNEVDGLEFLRSHIHTLEVEYDFWLKNHTVDVEHENKIYKMVRYIDQSQGPRPESYKEDIESARTFDTKEKKEEHYAELKTAAESGWDFSSRWFVVNGTNEGNLTNLKTRSIIPVELNSIMQWNAELLAEFYSRLNHNNNNNHTEKERYYRDIAKKFNIAIEKVLWHEEIGAWLDFNLETNRRREYFYPTNIAPLWTNSYDLSKKDYYVSRVINYLDKTKVDNFEGGIPTTFKHSGEQWDYPNAWPPLQYIVVVGLANTGVPEATRLAYEWATKWVRSNYDVWKLKSAMLEKYDATIKGGFGGGGEYELQTGFGWTNGVIMELLDTYGATLSATDAFESDTVPDTTTSSRPLPLPRPALARASMSAGGVLSALLAVLATLSAGALG